MTINSAVSGISSSPAFFPLSEFCLRIFVLLCYSFTNEHEVLRLRHKRILFRHIDSKLMEKIRIKAWLGFLKKSVDFCRCVFKLYIFISICTKKENHRTLIIMLTADDLQSPVSVSYWKPKLVFFKNGM